ITRSCQRSAAWHAFCIVRLSWTGASEAGPCAPSKRSASVPHEKVLTVVALDRKENPTMKSRSVLAALFLVFLLVALVATRPASGQALPILITVDEHGNGTIESSGVTVPLIAL